MNVLGFNNSELLRIAKGQFVHDDATVNSICSRVDAAFSHSSVPTLSIGDVSDLTIPDGGSTCFLFQVPNQLHNCGFALHCRLFGTAQFSVLIFDREGNMSHCVSQVQKSSGMDLLWLFHPTNNITSLPSSAFKDTLNSEILSPGKYLGCAFSNIQHLNTNHYLQVLFTKQIEGEIYSART
ncbi:uncharacterized protein LOC134854294 [Symsagittifera roscoffensis]|uniref:uncharacterized protein LOC134854294 n=1 Tax=Symsagittifera roscoffensis TaxID=84072 RepID=UPI00307B5067